MITRATAVGFKGLEFTHRLKKRNIIIGPNGSGKSAITGTIALTVNGRIPGAGKTNQAIMDAFASNDKMFIGVEVGDEALFERRFIRKVTQKFQAGNNLVTKEKFISNFSMVGKPTIFNLSAFLDLSDQKKIDTVFELYPPEGDVIGLHDQIEAATESLSELTATIKQTEGIIKKLTADQAEIELPAGTSAEVNKEIERTIAEVSLARKNLFTAQQREADRNAKEKAEAEAANKADEVAKAKEAEGKLGEEESRDGQEKTEEQRPQLCGDPGYTARNSEVYKEVPPEPALKYGSREYAKAMVEGSEGIVPLSPETGEIVNPEPTRKPGTYLSEETIALAESIKVIIRTMKIAGCTSCAAMLVAKRELQRF